MYMNKYPTNEHLKHVAFIMDGNGRWAKERHLPRHLGHKEGCNRIIEIFDVIKEENIPVMSLYAFSTENWKRPKAEIRHLFNYLEQFFKREIDTLTKDNVKVVISGDITKLPLKTQKTVNEAIERTKNNDRYFFNLCLNYGGRDEIVRATKNFAKDVLDKKIDIETLDENILKKYLYTHDLPDVDLLIRTGGDQRTSNFLPYQATYAELMFVKTYWPSFFKDDFRKCLEDFKSRHRRFGGLDEK